MLSETYTPREPGSRFSMQRSSASDQRPNRIPFSAPSPLLLILLFLGLVAIPGCPDAGVSNVVSGAVTLNGSPVAAEVTFIGADGKTVSGPTNPEGSYFINNPPTGDVKITLKPLPGAMPPVGGDKAKAPGDKATTDLTGKNTVKMGVPPPAKYASPDNGLKYEVKPGKHKFDITLTP